MEWNFEDERGAEPMAYQNGGGGNTRKQPYKHKPNRGTLFDNDKKTKDTQPDMTGTIDVGGTIYWISGWKELSQAGKRKLSLAVTLQEERQMQQVGERQQPQTKRGGW
jgi:hypothetical protein